MEPADIVRASRRGSKSPLSFPASYDDSIGQALLQALLQRRPEDRLGCGRAGYGELKSHEYFQRPDNACLFTMLAEWEIEPPTANKVSKNEKYMEQQNTAESISTTDTLVEFS